MVQRISTAAAFAVQAFIFLTLTTRLPDIRHQWDLSVNALSLVMLLMVLLAGVGSVASEQVATRWDSAQSLKVGLLLVGVGAPVVLLSPSLLTGVLGMALYGIGLGFVDAATNMQAVAVEQAYGRPLLPSFHGAWTVGAILAAVLAVATGSVDHALFAAVGLLALVVALAPHRRGARAAATADLKALSLPWRPIVLVGLGMMLFYMVDLSVQTWGATYAEEVFDLDGGMGALGIAGYLVASGLFRVAGDRMVQQVGAVTMLQIGAVVAVVGLALIVAAPVWAVAVVGHVMTGAGLAVTAPLSYSAAGRMAASVTDDPVLRQQAVDAVIARFNLFNYAGALLGSVLTGLVGGADLRWGFVLPAVLVLALIPLARSFAPATVGRH